MLVPLGCEAVLLQIYSLTFFECTVLSDSQLALTRLLLPLTISFWILKSYPLANPSSINHLRCSGYI